MNLFIGCMKSIYQYAMVEGHWKYSPWHIFLPKLKITIFQILTELARLHGISDSIIMGCLYHYLVTGDSKTLPKIATHFLSQARIFFVICNCLCVHHLVNQNFYIHFMIMVITIQIIYHF